MKLSGKETSTLEYLLMCEVSKVTRQIEDLRQLPWEKDIVKALKERKSMLFDLKMKIVKEVR